MQVLIDDGNAIRPPIGKRHVQEVLHRPETQRVARLAQSGRHRFEAGAEVLGHERAAPDHEREPGEGVQVDLDAELGQAEVQEEHLDEDRRVADHLDVDRSKLAERAGSGAREPRPRMSPSTYATTMPTTPAFIVSLKPSQNSWRKSQMKVHS